MISVFNMEKLNSLLKDFYTMTQIRITVMDTGFTELTAYPKQLAPICQLIRTDKDAHEKCRQCDKTACKIAARRHTSYTYQCHAGLTESIMPLTLGNIVVGYLLFGHVMTYPTHEDALENIRLHCADYALDHTQLEQLCLEHPLTDHEHIEAAAHILQAVASYVCLERMAVLNQEELSTRIDEYIAAHFTEAISIESICSHFQIGKTYLYEISDQCYGMGIAEHIRTLRIEKAKKLLTSRPELKIADISAQCGFHDYNYFITVFKRMVGIPPKQFAREAQTRFPFEPKGV